MSKQIEEYWGYLNDNPINALSKMIHDPHGIYHVVSKDTVVIEYHCNKCNSINVLQADFAPAPLGENCIAFPADNQLYCRGCQIRHNLMELRKDVEVRFQKLWTAQMVYDHS